MMLSRGIQVGRMDGVFESVCLLDFDEVLRT